MTTPLDESQLEHESIVDGAAHDPPLTEPAGSAESVGPAEFVLDVAVDPLLSVQEVCAWLNVARHWVYDEVEARRFPHVRLGRRTLRFRRQDIQAYLDGRAHTSAPPARESRSDYAVGFEDLESLD